MNREEFVDAIIKVVRDSTIRGIRAILNKPSGRKPSEKSVELSNWFNSLTEDDKAMVDKLTKEVADMTVFGFLATFDGVRSISDKSDVSLELYVKSGEQKMLLNTQSDKYLHDIFNCKVPY